MSQPVICPHCQAPVIETTGLSTGSIACPLCAEIIESSMVADQSTEWVAESIKRFEASERQNGGRSLQSRKQGANDAQKVMDVVTGVNLRWKDNLIQLVAIIISTVVGIPIGAMVAQNMRADSATGMVAGGFCGLLVGLLGSGFVLAIYRMFRH